MVDVRYMYTKCFDIIRLEGGRSIKTIDTCIKGCSAASVYADAGTNHAGQHHRIVRACSHNESW